MAVKSPAKQAATRKTSNRLAARARLAGGTDSEAFLAGIPERSPEGITAALAEAARAAGQHFIQAATDRIAPHPYNDPARSLIDGDNPRWTELVESISAAGVKVPVLLVTRAAFAAARPELVEQLDPTAEYVTIYGHRRRAAAQASGLAAIPAVVDDDVLSDGGDLDAMTIENLAREDLDEIQQAQMLLRYSEAGITQCDIAQKLGWSQSKVSRRMSLLLLTPHVIEGVRAGQISAAAAATLAGELPYGPPRPWQGVRDPAQADESRRTAQNAAYRLVIDAGMTPKRAAERVRAEDRARAQAAAAGIEVVDLAEHFGTDRHLPPPVSEPSEVDGPAIAAIDPIQGSLVYYPAAPPASPTAGPTRLDKPAEAKERAAAAKARRHACATVAARPPGRDKLLTLLAEQYAGGVARFADSAAGWKLAHQFVGNDDPTGPENPDDYQAQAARDTALKDLTPIVWALAIAGYELRAADKRRTRWDRIDRAYLTVLQEHANYIPTAWERSRLHEADLHDHDDPQ